MKVGDLVKHFDECGLVVRKHSFGRFTILWTSGVKKDIHRSNVQIEVISCDSDMPITYSADPM